MPHHTVDYIAASAPDASGKWRARFARMSEASDAVPNLV